MDYSTARRLAEEWCSAWNTHDLEKIVAHYADNVVLISPYALKRMGPESGGRVEGKETLRKYFSIGLETIPNLHFELLDVLLGVNAVTVFYKRESGVLVADVMSYNDKNEAEKVTAFYSQAV